MLNYLKLLGKGAGFVGFAVFTVGVLGLLQQQGHDVAVWTGPLGVICGGLYGGGFLKAFADAKVKNGS
jgi:hypothetical protein